MTWFALLAFVFGFGVGFLFFYMRNQKVILDYKILKETSELQAKLHQESQTQLELRMKELASQIFEQKSRDSLKGMETMLNPFKEKMTEFQRKVEEIHFSDTKDRLKLHSEIEKIATLGQRMSLETENLTRALKGDVKLQGNWGELILEKVLEASGLREGEEFILQGKDLSLKSEDGRVMLPDVVINLPEKKHLIIDSKVSLLSYERFINDNNEEDLKDFLRSLNEHIKGLSKKNYQSLDKLSTPDYVMMFIPIEGAFTLAMQKDKELFYTAWERNVVMVSPSTLLATLRTVASLWRQEKQNKNAFEIARQAGALYDKFVGVAEDIEAINTQLRRTADSVETLKSKMITGKGSLASRMENLRELGAKSSKQLINHSEA